MFICLIFLVILDQAEDPYIPMVRLAVWGLPIYFAAGVLAGYLYREVALQEEVFLVWQETADKGGNSAEGPLRFETLAKTKFDENRPVV